MRPLAVWFEKMLKLLLRIFPIFLFLALMVLSGCDCGDDDDDDDHAADDDDDVIETDIIVYGKNESWTTTDIPVDECDQIIITAAGKIFLDENQELIGPEGHPNILCTDECVIGDAPRGALIGWVGVDLWNPFLTGTHYDQPSEQTGRLYFIVNDDSYDDNGGYFSVAVRIENRECADDDINDDTIDDDVNDDVNDDINDDTINDDLNDDMNDDVDDDVDDDIDDDVDDDTEDYCPDVVGVVEEPEMQLIEAETFIMGSPDAELGHLVYENQHEVTLTRNFYMATYELTQDLWKGLYGYIFRRQEECGEDYPVYGVSWTRAVKFCNDLSAALGYEECYVINGDDVQWNWDCDGFRLPTEAEWEYAARAGSEDAFYNGDVTNLECADPLLNEIAWYCGNSGSSDAHVVGQLPANDYGLYDMHGNVWEWAWDGFDDEDQIIYPDGPVTDPTGPGGVLARSYRGGSMYATAMDTRVAYRRFASPGFTDADTAMRLCRTAAD